jgi:hypothetical protein
MKLFILCTLLIFTSCTSSLVFVDKNYIPTPNSKIALIPITPDVIKIYIAKDIENVFKYDHRKACEILADSINAIMKRTLADSLPTMSFRSSTRLDTMNISVHDDHYFRDFSNVVGKDSIRMSFRVPNKKLFDSLDKNISLYIIITSINFDRDYAQSNPSPGTTQSALSAVIENFNWNLHSTNRIFQKHSYSSDAQLAFNNPAPPYTPPIYNSTPFPLPIMSDVNKSASYLYATVCFAIWNRLTNKAVSYGEFTVKQNKSISASKGIWFLFEDIAKDLICKSHAGR